jgi:hypothetical protein
MLTLIVLRRLPARIGDESEMTLSNVADAPSLAHAEDPEEVPVAVEIAYQVRPGAREKFIRAAHALGKSRRRDGANVWRLYRDLSDPNRYVERFLVDSWSEYLRHRARNSGGSRSTTAHRLDADRGGFTQDGALHC